jgi:hypothetical protein
MDILVAFVILAFSLACRLLRWSTGARDSWAYTELLSLTLGDRERAERLIGLERTRQPAASREALIRCALSRLRRGDR